MLYLIRHGQTDWNVQGKFQGSRDIPLNEVGLQQAKELGKRLRESLANGELSITRLYASHLSRALVTAEAIGQALGLPVNREPALAERCFGRWEGLSGAEVREKFPEEYSLVRADRYQNSPEGGESIYRMLKRVLPVLQAMAQGEGNAAAVTHGGVIMGLQCCLSGCPYEEISRFRMDNLAIIPVENSDLARAAKDFYCKENNG